MWFDLCQKPATVLATKVTSGAKEYPQEPLADLRLQRGKHREGEGKGTNIYNQDQGVQEKRRKKRTKKAGKRDKGK